MDQITGHQSKRPLSLGTLPQEIIRNIGTFLRIKDLQHLAMTSRHCFQSVRSLGDSRNLRQTLHILSRYGHVNHSLRLLPGFREALAARCPDSESPMFEAVRWNNHKVALWLLDQGAPTYVQDETRAHGILHILPVYASFDFTAPKVMAERALADGHPIDLLDHKRRTPLMLALRNCQVDMVAWLLEHGANCYFADEEGNTCLHYAVAAGSDVMEQIYRLNPADLMATNTRGESPLHVALQAKKFEEAEALIRLGAAIDIEDHQGQVPIHRLAECGTFEPLLAVLDCHPEAAFLRDRRGNSILHLVMRDNHDLRHVPLPTLDVIQRLLDLGLDINDQNLNGWTPLHAFVRFMTPTLSTERITPFLAAFQRWGADFDSTGGTGDTPLLEAARSHRADLCELLIERGASADIRDQKGLNYQDLLRRSFFSY